jgi:prepilin-type N-terminal cleavage/methylation domain-containing protein
MRTASVIAVTIQRRNRGFSLVETVVAMALLGLVCMALFSGLCNSTFSVHLSRDNLRATQIMAEKLDTIRLYSWKQLTNHTYIREDFDTPLHPPDPSSPPQADAPVYKGAIYIETPPISEFYGKDMRLVTVELKWKTGELERTRSMSTLVSRYGMHKYVY